MLSESESEKTRLIAAMRLVRTVRHSFRALAQAADRLHGDLGVTAAMRVVLEQLSESGPMTVPQMARAKGVSRQHVQTKTDLLLARGLVEARANPAHARSVLIGLTEEGQAVFAEMRAREAGVLTGSVQGLDAAEIEAADRLLERLVSGLQRDDVEPETKEENNESN